VGNFHVPTREHSVLVGLEDGSRLMINAMGVIWLNTLSGFCDVVDHRWCGLCNSVCLIIGFTGRVEILELSLHNRLLIMGATERL